VTGAALAVLAALATGGLEEVRASLASEVARLAAAVRAGDAAGVAAAFPPALRCGTREVARPRLVEELGRPGSWLHDFFLDAPAFARSRGAWPGSLAGALSAPGERWRLYPRLDGPSCAAFGAGDDGDVLLCFERAGGRWRLAQVHFYCDVAAGAGASKDQATSASGKGTESRVP
jgi:hypothetical protein